MADPDLTVRRIGETDGARLLIAGATPGAVYAPPDPSKLGQLPLAGPRSGEGY